MTDQTYPGLGFYIDGQWTRGSGSSSVPVIDPSTEEILGDLPAASQDDVDRAITAAQRAFVTWSRTPPAHRAALLHQAASLIRKRSAEFSRLMALEMGKPIADGPLEVERGAQHLEWNAAEAVRTYGRIIPGNANTRQSVLRVPVGPVAAFTPWNGPLASPARKSSAAIASGCTLVIKPAEESPATALLLMRCYEEAGLPAGVVNMIFGNPAQTSQRLISSPEIRMATFTGSIPVGRRIGELAGRHLKPAILELGGHSPVVVCRDADPVKAAMLSVKAKYRNSGQICVSPTRFYVHDDIYGRFEEAFTTAAKAVKVGNGMDPAVEMGPLASGRRLDAIEKLVTTAIGEGARLAAGGARVGKKGFFFAPTLLADVPDEATAMREEPFGPVALLTRFSDIDEVCMRANSTDFGLAAYAFTESATNAAVLSQRLNCGIMSINFFGGPAPEVPFGGVRDSGFGREGGAECFDGYMVPKFVAHMVDETATV